MLTTVLSQPVHDVFVQHDKSFRRTDRQQYERMLEARAKSAIDINPSENIQTALTVQTVFHNTSLKIQGFLSGFATSHAILAFVLDAVKFTRPSFLFFII